MNNHEKKLKKNTKSQKNMIKNTHNKKNIIYIYE